MKKYTFPFLLTLFLVFITITATAQSWSQKFDPDIIYSLLNKQNRFVSAFNLLASNNNKNVNNLRLQLGFNIQFSISKNTDNQIILKYKNSNQKITGDVFFRDFRIDTLLLPGKLTVEFLIYQNSRLIDTLYRTISMEKGRIVLPLPGNITSSSLSADMKIKQAIFTQNEYDNFLQTAGLINHYYGYREIMQEMPELLLKASGEQLSAASYFLNYISLKRLENYIRLHNLIRNLHLNRHDPLQFKKTFDAMLRRQIRMKTLSQQQLQKKFPTDLKDKENFARGFVALSLKTISLSNEQQPYIATSFSEFARIFPGKEEAAFVKKIQTYYDRNIPTEQATVSQEIYKYFIDAASLKIKQQSYVRALNLLVNAAYFEHHFPGVKRIAQFDSCLVHARDGLATSYLKVAKVASENNDNHLANKYVTKASGSLKAFNNEIKSPAGPVCYQQFAGEIIHMAETTLKQGRYLKAQALINTAFLACPKLPGIDSLRADVCEKLLNNRLDISGKLLEQNHIMASRDTLLQIVKDYEKICPYNSNPEQNNEITGTATAIFQQALAKGEQLHNLNRNVQAITYLKTASELQSTFSLPASPHLDTLITETTVPYILSIAEEANLEIWKKHFQKADFIYQLAQSLSLRYHVSENQKIKEVLGKLTVKIKIAGCQWKQEEISRLFTQTNRAVKAYQMDAAKSYFLKAKQLFAHIDLCQQDKAQTDSALASYEKLFHFTDAYHRLTLQLFRKGFAAVLPEFVKLEIQYRTEHLEKFRLPYTDLYAFIRSQHSEKLTMDAVHYFIREKSFTEALRYLQLSGNAAKEKALQKQIAMGLANKDIQPRNLFLSQPEWAYFAKMYRKALATKGR